VGGLNGSSNVVDGSYCVLNRLWDLNNSSNVSVFIFDAGGLNGSSSFVVMFIWLFAS